MKKRKMKPCLIICVFVCILSLTSCKNGGDNSELFNSEGFEPTTTEEIQSIISTTANDNFQNPDMLVSFYESRNYEPAWNNEDTREALQNELEKASEEGLSPEDYKTNKLLNLFQNSKKNTKADRVSRELLLTDAFFGYAEDLFYGKVDPRELYSLWGLKRKSLNQGELLEKALAQNDIAGALNSLKPRNGIYDGLKKSLQEYRTLKEQDSVLIQIPAGETLEANKKDARTLKLVARLKQLGFLDKQYEQLDSLYDSHLQEAVKAFQEEKGLEPDGVVGNATLKHLNQGYSELYKKIMVNLERWRWFPRDLGDHYIMVNIADFKLALVKDGDTLRRHNVIAGSKQRQTPIFTDTLEYIVINPVWNIPPTIQREDIVPKASANPSYLTRNNISVTAPNGEQVNPANINWSDPDIADYRFTQSAGPSNPLGRVKIIYPNQYIIYLHDTPAQALFQREDRAESSGCVRVEGAIDLASYVVENQEDWSLERIQETIASGQTKQVKITRPIQVHHLYWTAWRGRDKTYFADDVYDLDQEVYTALTAPGD